MGESTPEIESGAGGSRELLRLAAPLILSSSFFTLQMTIERLMLSSLNSEAVGAAMTAAVNFWTPMALLWFTAMYASTFVAQYVGAGRPERAGAAVWQAIWFSIAAGLAFLLFIPFLEPLYAWVGHDDEIRHLEVEYTFYLCFATLPFLLVQSINAFFSGRGDTWRVLLTDACGATVAVILCYAWISGHWGFPAMGMRGAGLALICGNWFAVAVALSMFLRPKYRREFGTLRGWRFDPALFRRLMRFGLPSGAQYCLEALAFNVFLILIGRLGGAELSATSIVFTINMVALVPMMGLGQAISVLVGQRLGMNRPDIAQKTALRGIAWCLLYTLVAATFFLGLPETLARQFEDPIPARWAVVGPMIPTLLKFVALYCLFECVSLMISSALRGAGDTRFVSASTFVFSWSIMVIPIIIVTQKGGNLYSVWAFATAYLMVLSCVLSWRFWQGKWKSMRVIESAPDVPVSIGEAIAEPAVVS